MFIAGKWSVDATEIRHFVCYVNFFSCCLPIPFLASFFPLSNGRSILSCLHISFSAMCCFFHAEERENPFTIRPLCFNKKLLFNLSLYVQMNSVVIFTESEKLGRKLKDNVLRCREERVRSSPYSISCNFWEIGFPRRQDLHLLSYPLYFQFPDFEKRFLMVKSSVL